MKRPKKLFRGYGIQIIAVAAGLALIISLLWFRLGSLAYGNAAEIEQLSQQAAGSWQAIFNNPLYAPYNFVQRLIYLTGNNNVTALRLVSTLFAALAAVLFYFVARQWHSLKVAVLATWLFVTSAWFLHVGRLGSPEILWLVSMLAIVIILTPNRNGRQSRLALPSTLAVLGAVLYVPGMIWLVLTGIVLQRKSIREAWEATSAGWQRVMSIVLGLGVIAPLVYGLAKSPELVRRWLGIAPELTMDSTSARVVLENILGVPKSLFYSSSFDPVHWLGSLPLLSSFEIIMFLLGLYFYVTRHRAARSRMIFVLAGLALLLVGISGLNAISLVVPVVYLLVAAGIAYIIHLWLKVFPINPVARTLGVTMVMVAVLLTSVYQTRSYFVAWRYHEATTQAFRISL